MGKTNNKRVERLIFQCLITAKSPTKEEAMKSPTTNDSGETFTWSAICAVWN